MFNAKIQSNRPNPNATENQFRRSFNSEMDSYRFENVGYYQVIDNGTYYYPAWKHYNRRTNVFCDRCGRQNLEAAIGYDKFDLCLTCVDELTRKNYDCAKRHCHGPQSINDNVFSYQKNKYIDLNDGRRSA